jgi:uncharacterized protein (DUF4415 family)
MSRKTRRPVLGKENPEWTREDFAKATKFPAGVRLSDMKPAQLASLVGKRGPQKAPTKIPVSIRLSPEVVQHFKAKGPGWQSKIDAALRKMVKKAG